MQEVLFINNIENIKFLTKNISRIYFGTEFCDHLLPSGEDLDSLINIANKHKISLSIVTPYLNEYNFTKVIKMFSYLNKKMPNAEVIINDFGVLSLIKKRFNNFSIILGRLLSRQKRGFFVKGEDGENILMEDLNLKKADRDYMQYSILQNDYMMGFLNQIGIGRVSLDNVKQGIIFGNNRIDIDLYYPCIFITTSNYCLTSSIYKPHEKRARVDKCNGICKRARMKEMEICGEKIYLCGNTQFYFNDKFNKVNLEKIDRLIKVIL